MNPFGAIAEVIVTGAASVQVAIADAPIAADVVSVDCASNLMVVSTPE